MKKGEIFKRISCLILACMMLGGCGEKKVSDDMDTDEAIEYAYGLLEENKDSDAEDLNDDMVDDAIADFMGDLEAGEEITELPEGLNLKQLIEIQKEHPGLVKRNLSQKKGGDRTDDPLSYFVFDDYKITKEYWETTPISQVIADLCNNVEWKRVGASVGLASDIDPEEKVDLSDVNEVKNWLESQLDERGKAEEVYFHFIYFETEDCSYADKLTIRINIEDINAEATNNCMTLEYTCHASGSGADENWECCCFSRKEDGTYYLFESHEDPVFQRRNWSGEDL